MDMFMDVFWIEQFILNCLERYVKPYCCIVSEKWVETGDSTSIWPLLPVQDKDQVFTVSSTSAGKGLTKLFYSYWNNSCNVIGTTSIDWFFSDGFDGNKYFM